MKQIIFGIAALTVLALCAWIFFRQSAKTIMESTTLPLPPPPTNIIPALVIKNVPSGPQPTPAKNAFMRPDSIDESHWNQLMFVRQMELERNQPIEFYARVVDQNEQPIEGAKCNLILTFVNENLFQTTNFFKMNMGEEVSHKTIEIISDANGWLQLTNCLGYSVDFGHISKDGYAAVRNYYGGEMYEPRGIRRTFGDDILMTNFYNPKRGYTFHLRMIKVN